ncbi:hypothetical protein FHR84_000663 [Actinopolyspora biskrensis]|uniref:Uncharacterized protein n=1 Tax=Actinopolyspora biskrensis TaxID=1470178 RepID=A0A852YUV5_9ACTN|nr:hypothetical protein [Actinopolyspora biskrensis]NYH77349.1 hypothetical protein [Actinopolyspora biskrensis]
MAELPHFSKPYLGQVETGTRAAAIDVVAAYERVSGAEMWRKEITHPGLTRIKGAQRLSTLAQSIQSGSPDVFSRLCLASDISRLTQVD